MKKKYTLTVADSQINVITEEPKEAIDTIVGVVDRRIREIHLHSPSCSRVDAAILLCLDYCAEKLQLKKKLKQSNAEIERLTVLNEAAARENAALEREIETLRQSLNMSSAKPSAHKAASAQLAFDDLTAEENEPLVIITEDAREAQAEESAKGEPAVESAVDKILADVEPDAQEQSAEAPDQIAEPEEGSSKKGKKKKVRSMFDLISFDDI
jgi:cell division protein ZapA (FtsZ GTPase activity inhibitor)